jgi:O-antigen ligase/tetratricopeptide (TPR) repeat protein
MPYFDNLPRTVSRCACVGIEGTVLLMAAAAPWMFGSVHPLSELLLTAGLAVILLFWAVRLAATGGPLWSPGLVGIGLGLLCVLAMVQLMPLSDGMLRAMAPGTAGLYDQLQPATSAEAAAPRTISVAPFATRAILVKLIALLALFAAVRANLTSPGTLYRLAIVVVVNGVLLSFVGLVQFFTSPRNVLFWTFESEGRVFGPFICRNHFAYLINLSLGMGAGLLLCMRKPGTAGRWDSPRGLLQEPAVLWLASAMTLMGAGLVCSLSRGGVAAFFSAALVCVIVKLWHAPGTIRLRSGLVLAAAGLAAIAAVGGDYAGKRLATMWETNVLEEGRASVWSRSLLLVNQSPLLGTGFGTFRFVEPLTRTPADGSGIVHEHVHNDFLEALIEGGIVQLVICAGIIAALLYAGVSAHGRLRDRWEGNLVLGALFGLTAVLVHSAVDFGMHIPAVTLLTTILAALVLNLAEYATTPAREPAAPSAGGRIVGLVGVAVLLAVAFFLVESAWRAEQAERYRLAASRVDDADRKVAYLEAALAYTPANALLEVAAAEAYRERYSAAQDRLHLQLTVQLTLQPAVPTWPGAVSWTAAWSERPADDDLQLALRHHLLARAACSLLPQPHLFLAAYPQVLARGERPGRHMQRACRLDPANAKSWYVAGLCEYQDGNYAAAWASWRRSLTCNSAHLPAILGAARPMLSTEELRREVLPDDPAILFAAAQHLEQAAAPDGDVHLLLLGALQLLEGHTNKDGGQLALQARIQARLERLPEACASYRLALALAPRDAALRLELGELLVRTGNLADARNELVALLSIHPDNERARSLYDGVLRDLAEQKK